MVAPIVAFGGILLASFLDPTFSWTGSALSHLGVGEVGIVFNGALVAGGLLGIVFAAGLWTAGGYGQRLVALTFGLAMICLGGVGVFPTGHRFHLGVAGGFYALVTVCFLFDGLVRRDEPTGLGTLGLVGLHVLIWSSWMSGWWPGDGLALPEFAGALLVLAWVWVVGPTPTLPYRAKASVERSEQ